MHIDPILPPLVGLVLSLLLLGLLLKALRQPEIIGYQAGIITGYAYQMSIAIIAVSLLFSAPWIALMRRLVGRPEMPSQ
jgi:hypothetical protein